MLKLFVFSKTSVGYRLKLAFPLFNGNAPDDHPFPDAFEKGKAVNNVKKSEKMEIKKEPKEPL